MRWSSVASSLCVLLTGWLLVPAVAPSSVAQEPAAKAKADPPKAAPQPDPKAKAPDPKAAAKPDPKAAAKPDPKAAPQPKVAPKAAPKEQEFVEDASGGRLLLARRELTKNADGVYIVATESKLASFVENLPQQHKQIAGADSAISKFHRDYRATLNELVQLEQQYQTVTNQMKLITNPQQKTAAAAFQKGVATKKSEAGKALGMMPQHHNTHELMVQQARKGYIDGILAGKKQAGEVTGLYDKLKKDPLVEKALKLMSAADGKTYTLGPGAEFKNQLEKLEKAEGQLLKSEIEVEESGKTWLAEVLVNGKQKHKFQVSPTSKLTLINNEMAQQMGVMIHPLNPKSPFNVGMERLSVPEVIFPSLTLGDIKATNVRVLIVPKGSAEPPVLGSSFFNGMISRVDAKAKKLLVTRVKD